MKGKWHFRIALEVAEVFFEKKRPFISCCRAKVTAKLSNGRKGTGGVNVSSADSGVKVPLSRPPKRRRRSLTEEELA